MTRALIALLLAAALLGMTCPQDGSSAFFTGATQNGVNGALLKQYQCTAYGHTFWSR